MNSPASLRRQGPDMCVYAVRSGLRGVLRHENQADRRAGDYLAVEGNVDAVITALVELETLEVHDEVAGQEGCTFGQSDGEVTDDGHVLLVQGSAVLIDDRDAKLVVTGVLGGKAKAEGQGAGGVHDGELAGEKSIKGALNAELALIIGGVVAKYCYLNIHCSMYVKCCKSAVRKCFSCCIRIAREIKLKSEGEGEKSRVALFFMK